MTAAPTISLAPSGGFTVAFEAHSVHIPSSLAGLATLKRVLLARERDDDQRIGTEATPTQHDIDRWLTVRAALASQTVDLPALNMEGIDL